MLGLRPRTFNCQLENVKSQKGYTFNLVKRIRSKAVWLNSTDTIKQRQASEVIQHYASSDYSVWLYDNTVSNYSNNGGNYSLKYVITVLDGC